MEKYMSQCLDSLLVPNIDDVEILVINDGSKDKTSEIAHDYECCYPKSIRVIDKVNGHYGSCINSGLKISTGKYVKVLDADDSFDKDNFQAYLEFLESTNADIILSDYCIVDETRVVTAIKRFPNISEKLSFKEALPLLTHKNMGMHGVAYKTEMLIKNNYFQTEGLPYTDQEWIFLPVLYGKTVKVFPNVIYKYLVGRQGQSVDPSISIKNIDVKLKLISKRVNIYEKQSKYLKKEQHDYALTRLRTSLVSMFRMILFHTSIQQYREDLRKIDDKIKHVFPELYNSLNEERIKPNVPFYFIKYWRNRYTKGKSLPILAFFNALFK